MPETNQNHAAELLIGKFLEDALSPEEGEKLLTLFEENPLWEKKTLEHARTIAMLQDIGRSHSDIPGEMMLVNEWARFSENTVTYQSKSVSENSFQNKLLFPLVALVVLLLAILFLGIEREILYRKFFPGKIAIVGPSEEPEQMSNTVALLTRTAEVVWDHEDETPLTPGTPLPPRWLHLKSGMVAIQFHSGASVVVEGPASFQIISDSKCACLKGKVFAEVPLQATGFTIDSPQMNIIDLGTSFTINVTSEMSEVHVLKGEVDAIENPSNQERNKRNLKEGEALRVTKNGLVEQFHADSYNPMGKLTELSVQDAQQKIRAWQESRSHFENDSSLIVWFDFQTPPDDWGRLINRATPCDETTGRTEGVVVGATPGVGRWQGKGAIVFQNLSDRVCMSVPGSRENITLSVSIRVDNIDRNLDSIFMTEKFEKGPFHWQILNKVENGECGAIRLGLKAPIKGNVSATNFDTPPLFTPDRLGRWVHLAVVVNADAYEVIHYFDGKPISRHPMEFNSLITCKKAELGNWTTDSLINPIRYFSGAIDEFFFFARALTDKEIQLLHQ